MPLKVENYLTKLINLWTSKFKLMYKGQEYPMAVIINKVYRTL